MRGVFIIQRKKLYFVSLHLAVIIFVLSIFIAKSTGLAVALTINGDKEVVVTHADTVGELLKDKNIELKPEDKISQSANTQIEENMSISLKTSKSIKLKIGEKEKTYKTVANTVKDFLFENGMKVNKYDIVQPALNTSVKQGMTIEVEKATPVNLIVNGKKKKIWTQQKSVTDVLKEQGVELSYKDRVESSTKHGISIKVIRVKEKTGVERKEVHYKVVKRNDSSLLKGTEKVVQNGVDGTLKRHYVITYENGKKIKKELERQEIVKQAKDKIVYIGTKEKTKIIHQELPATLNAASFKDRDTNNSKEFYVTATAYTANCFKCSGTTKTGINLLANPTIKVIAVDPRVIPLGSRVWVEGYGNAIAADTGGDIKNNRIDVFIASESKAKQFGVRNVKVKVLSSGSTF